MNIKTRVKEVARKVVSGSFGSIRKIELVGCVYVLLLLCKLKKHGHASI